MKNITLCSLLLQNEKVIYTHLWNCVDLNNALKNN